jgi:argininosuccinate lyase
VIADLTIRPEQARRAASGLLLATDVADYLVRAGLPFRQAHETVGRIARELAQAGRTFADLSLEDWRRYSEYFSADVRDAVTPDASVRARRTPQSTSPDAVREALAETRRWLAGHGN